MKSIVGAAAVVFSLLLGACEHQGARPTVAPGAPRIASEPEREREPEPEPNEALADQTSYCDIATVLERGGSDVLAARACEVDKRVERESGTRTWASEAAELEADGRRLHREGDTDRAREHYERALGLADETDEIRPVTQNHLGLLEYESGHSDAARKHLQLAIAETEVATVRAVALHNLGLVRMADGDLDGAREAVGRAERILAAELGRRHASTVTCLHTLGVISAAQGDLDEAVQQLTRAVGLRSAVLGPTHPLTATSLTSLGVAHGRRGAWGSALQAHEQALAIDEEVLGPRHPTTAVDRAYVGEAQHHLGDDEAATRNFGAALRVLEKDRAADDPELARLRSWLAKTRGRATGKGT